MIEWSLDTHGIATLTLDRPVARNAIPVAAWQVMADQLARIAAGGARVLLVRSAADGVFSAGADITEFQRYVQTPAAAAEFRGAMRMALDRLAALPIPTIALVEGGCYGAGVALILACDINVAAPTARFAITPARLGIAYPGEDVRRLIDRVGRGQAGRMLFTAAAIDAAEAARIGLVELVGDDAPATAEYLARSIAAHAPEPVALLKAILANPEDPAHAAAFDAAFARPAFAQAIAAFTTRRQ